jgi:hypothetical protein
MFLCINAAPCLPGTLIRLFATVNGLRKLDVLAVLAESVLDQGQSHWPIVPVWERHLHQPFGIRLQLKKNLGMLKMVSGVSKNKSQTILRTRAQLTKVVFIDVVAQALGLLQIASNLPSEKAAASPQTSRHLYDMKYFFQVRSSIVDFSRRFLYIMLLSLFSPFAVTDIIGGLMCSGKKRPLTCLVAHDVIFEDLVEFTETRDAFGWIAIVVKALHPVAQTVNIRHPQDIGDPFQTIRKFAAVLFVHQF